MKTPTPRRSGSGYELDIRDLLDGTPSDRMGVAFLHSALLPRSPVVRLGYPFMTEYYYRQLVHDRLIGCQLALVSGRPAGFVAYTTRPHDFMLAGLRRNWPDLTTLVARALLARPSRVTVVARALGMLKRRRDDLAGGPVYDGEILSLAVLPQYRSPRFVHETGLHIGRMLFDIAVSRSRAAGAKILVTLVPARDHETLIFLHSMGCQFHREWIDGADCYEVTYRIPDPDTSSLPVRTPTYI